MKHIAWVACLLGTSSALAFASLGGCGTDDTGVTDNGDGGGSSSGGGSSGTSSSGAASSSGASSSGGSSSGSSGNNDGGSSSGSTVDGGSPSNPGKVTCEGTECSGATPECCYTFGFSSGSITSDAGCVANNGCTGGNSVELRCDEKADCPNADAGLCCYGGGGASCRSDCGMYRVQACKTSTECADGGTCAVYTCQGRKVELCAQPQFGCN
jgi:hypothetical protein